jgi:ResB-like family
MGTLTFTGYRQWISLAITYDPGQLPALIAAIAALAGLLVSFLVRRRRVFLRAVPAAGGGSTVEFAGLARTESSETFGGEFADLWAELSAALAGSAERGPHGNAPAGTAVATAGERGPHGNAPAGITPSGRSPTAHADASAVPTAAPDVPSADTATDVPSETDERE